jgi:hypothetical protein
MDTQTARWLRQNGLLDEYHRLNSLAYVQMPDELVKLMVDPDFDRHGALMMYLRGQARETNKHLHQRLAALEAERAQIMMTLMFIDTELDALLMSRKDAMLPALRRRVAQISVRVEGILYPEGKTLLEVLNGPAPRPQLSDDTPDK